MIARLALAAVLVLAALAPSAPAAWSQDGAQVSAGCSPAAVAQRRTDFQAAYDRRDYEAALAVIDPLWRECFADKPFQGTRQAQLESDLALTLHHTGDDSGCLQMLETYSPERERRPVAAMAALPPPLQSAIRHNFRLCAAFCEGAENYTDAACAWLRVDAQFEGLEAGDFRARPCPFKAPRGAVGLPGGQCLMLTPSSRPFSLETDDQAPAEAICPGLALVDARGRRTPLAVPKESFLRNSWFCCADPRLASAPDGRIEIQPADNPPENCLSGHREQALQDVLRLDGKRLTLLHRLHPD